jgi:hypothetical protein
MVLNWSSDRWSPGCRAFDDRMVKYVLIDHLTFANIYFQYCWKIICSWKIPMLFRLSHMWLRSTFSLTCSAVFMDANKENMIIFLNTFFYNFPKIMNSNIITELSITPIFTKKKYIAIMLTFRQWIYAPCRLYMYRVTCFKNIPWVTTKC